MATIEPQSDIPQIIPANLPRILELVRRNRAIGRWDRVLARFGKSYAESASDESLIQRRQQLRAHLVDLPASQVGADLLAHLNRDVRLQDYLLNVHDTFLTEHDRVDALLAGDAMAWNGWHSFLRRRARVNIRRYTWQTGRTWLDVDDVAQKASMEILAGHFPCDVPFEAWSSRLVSNLVHAAFRLSQDLHDHRSGVISLDAFRAKAMQGGILSTSHELLPHQHRAWQYAEIRMLVEDAVARIRSADRRTVVIDTFFTGLSDEEIAQHLDTTLSNVHVLRYRALRELRTILERDRANYG